MDRITLVIILLIGTLAFGCSSGGSSKPISIATAPAITSIFPANGSSGTLVTIQGANFGVVQSTSFVSYAGVTVAPITWSDTQIAVEMPVSTSGNGYFVVVVGGVYSNSSVPFGLSSPSIFRIWPEAGAIGSEVTIEGQGFGAQSGYTYVTFNQTSAAIRNWNNNRITCTVPELSNFQSNSVAVVVWLDAQRYSNSYSFNLPTPAIDGINPNSDNVGARITISGQSFGKTQGPQDKVVIDGYTAQIVNWSENSIEFRVPQVNTAGWKPLTLTAGGRQANSSSFNVAAPAAVTYLPSPIGKDVILTITGGYFGTSDDQVYGSTIARSVSIAGYGYATNVSWSDNSISFIWPVANAWLGNKTVELTISVGGLTQTFTVEAK